MKSKPTTRIKVSQVMELMSRAVVEGGGYNDIKRGYVVIPTDKTKRLLIFQVIHQSGLPIEIERVSSDNITIILK